MWPAKGHVGVWSGHPKGRRHSFPTMTGLARKVGDLVHDQRSEGRSLSPRGQMAGGRGRERGSVGGREKEVWKWWKGERSRLLPFLTGIGMALRGRFGNGGKRRSIDLGGEREGGTQKERTTTTRPQVQKKIPPATRYWVSQRRE